MLLPISLPPGANYVEGPKGDPGEIVGVNLVQEYGLDRTGALAIDGAIQLAFAEKAGRTLFLREGTYRFDSTLAIPANTCLHLEAGATLQCRVAGGLPGITLADAAVLLGSGAGANTSQVIAHASCDVSSLIENLRKDGTQEYAFIEGLTISAQGGAVVGVALVNLVSLFVNSAIRHCTILCSSVAPTGLRIAGGASVGCGPVVAEDIWVTHGVGHNIIVTENNPQTGHCSVWLNEITSEHPAAGAHGLYLKGFGSLQNVKVRNYHYESGIADGANSAALYADFVPGLLVDGAEVLSSPITNKKGIVLVNCYRAQVRNVVNPNLVNPILEDAQHSVTLAGITIGFYESANAGAGTPEQRFVHPVRFDGGLTAFGSNFLLDNAGQTVKVRADAVNNRAIVMTQPDGTATYGFTNPTGSGGEMRIRYIDGGIDILRFGTNGSFRHASTLLGLYGAAAVTKPTVTGSRGGNAALASLLTGLANVGLITDSSSA